MERMNPPLRVYPQDFFNHINFYKNGTAIPRRIVNRAINRYLNRFYDCLDRAAAGDNRFTRNGRSIRRTLRERCGWFAREGLEDIDEFALWCKSELLLACAYLCDQ